MTQQVILGWEGPSRLDCFKRGQEHDDKHQFQDASPGGVLWP